MNHVKQLANVEKWLNSKLKSYVWCLTDFSVWQEASQVQISRNMLKCPGIFVGLCILEGCALHTWDGCYKPLFQHEAWPAWSWYKLNKNWNRKGSTPILFSCFFVPVIWGTVFYHNTLHIFLCCFCIFLCCSPAAAFVFWLLLSLFFG